mmetsp:Transcript_162606/g.521291  ORF Transcript_162606/g.521291 Transcript_162606/m.521291 type:complete len:503 (-) Transcript_162606:2-1510(-)
MDGLRALVGERADTAEVGDAALGRDVGVALEEPPVVVHAVGFLHPRVAGVDAARGLGGVAAHLLLLLDDGDPGTGLRGLDGGAETREASADDHHVGVVVAGVPVLPMLCDFGGGLPQADDTRAPARVEQVVQDRILEARASEHVQQLPALLRARAGDGHGGRGQRIREHARGGDHGGAGAAVAGDLDCSATSRVQHMREAAPQRLHVVPRGGHGLPVSELDVGQVLLDSTIDGTLANFLLAGRFHDTDRPISAGRVGASDLNVATPINEARREAGILQLLCHLVDGPALGQAAEVQLRVRVRPGDARVVKLEIRPLAALGHFLGAGAAVLVVQVEGQDRGVEGPARQAVQRRRGLQHQAHGRRRLVHLPGRQAVDLGHLAVRLEVAEGFLRLVGNGVDDLLGLRLRGLSVSQSRSGDNGHLVGHAAPHALQNVQLALGLPVLHELIVIWGGALGSRPASSNDRARARRAVCHVGRLATQRKRLLRRGRPISQLKDSQTRAKA